MSTTALYSILYIYIYIYIYIYVFIYTNIYIYIYICIYIVYSFSGLRGFRGPKIVGVTRPIFHCKWPLKVFASRHVDV